MMKRILGRSEVALQRELLSQQRRSTKAPGNRFMSGYWINQKEEKRGINREWIL
jgi:hypothetical protein